MRMKILLPTCALALAALPAAAAPTPTDLSRPGALERLKSERPDHYDYVIEVAKAAERLNCHNGKDLPQLRELVPVDALHCGFIKRIPGPPTRKVNFALEGVPYVMTVRLLDVPPVLINARIIPGR